MVENVDSTVSAESTTVDLSVLGSRVVVGSVIRRFDDGEPDDGTLVEGGEVVVSSELVSFGLVLVVEFVEFVFGTVAFGDIDATVVAVTVED